MPLDVALEVLHVEALHRADLEEDRVRGDDAARLEAMVLDVAPDMHPDFVGGGLRRATYVGSRRGREASRLLLYRIRVDFCW